jgi:hypothetical protein
VIFFRRRQRLLLARELEMLRRDVERLRRDLHYLQRGNYKWFTEYGNETQPWSKSYHVR